MKLKKNIILALIFSVNFLSAQVGIFTENPRGVLHIDGMSDNPSEGIVNEVQAANDFIISETGNIGVGTVNPKVKVDLRSNINNDNSVGISYTSMSATEAGAGAIRYVDTSGGKIQVSNGTVWQDILSFPTKVSVVSRINIGGGTQRFTYNTPKTVNNWQKVTDLTDSFNADDGVFTAPRNGIYTFNFSYAFQLAPILSNGSIETEFYKNNSQVIVKCLKTFGKSTRPAQGGGSCSTSVFLEKNETIQVRLNQKIDNTTTGGRALRTTLINNPPYNSPNFGFNNLTIYEE